MRSYEITYKVLQPGVSQAEAADIEEQTGVFSFPIPAPGELWEPGGGLREDRPHHADQVAAIMATLAEGEEPLITRIRLVD
ncbi:hypothetical protein [Streptomyces zhihengii]|uniref:hypothetical protein n=1 Tax=Streptomyces zhihengii TaxID=1818004 RepID=UPI0033B7E2B6